MQKVLGTCAIDYENSEFSVYTPTRVTRVRATLNQLMVEECFDTNASCEFSIFGKATTMDDAIRMCLARASSDRPYVTASQELMQKRGA